MCSRQDFNEVFGNIILHKCLRDIAEGFDRFTQF
jgi:hypothetical protein